MKKHPVLIPLILSLVAVIAGVLILVYFFMGRSANPPLRTADLQVGEAHVTVEIADTMLTRMRGLSNRKELPARHGMLFIFSSAGSQSFWMKETLIPLDLVWIRDGLVVGVTPNVPTQIGVPLTSLISYPSPSPVNQVLELNAGESATLGIATGTTVVVTQPAR